MPELSLSNFSQQAEVILSQGLLHIGPLTILFVFLGGLLTSLGPCSISLLPITVAYLAGFKNNQSPLYRSFIFCGGIILSLVSLGILSSFVGNIFGQVPSFLSTLVSLIAILMGLNLLGVLKFQLPSGPDPDVFRNKVPNSIAPMAAGFAFGLASTPCTTPILAVLLAFIAKTGSLFTGIVLLASFGIGQVAPLILAGTVAASIPLFLDLRPISKWISPLSGAFFLFIGLLTLISKWI